MRHYFLSILKGPFNYQSKASYLFFFALCLFLTIVTQIGGVVLWLSVGICYMLTAHLGYLQRKSLHITVFLVLYSLCSFVMTPQIAPLFGRVQLNCFDDSDHYKSNALLYCALNRNYVTKALYQELIDISQQLDAQYPGLTVNYLDGSFPFIDGFPMLPHLSHKDGKKLDLTFYYRDQKTDSITENGAWPIGYFAFSPAEKLIGPACDGKAGPLRWNFKWLQANFDHYELDQQRTKFLIDIITQTPSVEKIFVEPPLVTHLGLSHEKLRFAGCFAARHDDHIHFQIY